MANFRRLVQLPINRLAARQFSVASRSAAYLRVDPAPYERETADASLAAVIEKEKGPWKDLTKEEKLQLYRAQFPETFQTILAQGNHTKPVVGGIAVGLAIAIGFFIFLKTYIGPEPPKTINAEWRAASAKKRKLYRQNPISES